MNELLIDSHVENLAATERLSGEIYRQYLSDHRNCLLLLEGELGAGKTAFVHALGPALGLRANINSPTFNLLNVYENPRRAPDACDLYHYDLYRVNDPREFEQLDFVERWTETPRASEPARLHAIEWWQRAGDALPRTVARYRLVLELIEPDMNSDGVAIADAGADSDVDFEERRRIQLYRL